MILQLTPMPLSGKIKAIASKSVAHRLLICAAFADRPTDILCEELNRDIEATAACLRALGAGMVRNGTLYHVTPIRALPEHATLPCGESGSTLRFLVPVVAALGVSASFVMESRLPDRPLSPLREELEAHGVCLSAAGSNPLELSGKLIGSRFSIAGNVSSQFISGLLFALSLRAEPSVLTVVGKIESAPYLEITADALSLFSARPEQNGSVYTVSACGKLISPGTIAVEGDWSNASFALSAGAIGKHPVTVYGLNPHSHQGDRAMVSLLERFGAKIEEHDGSYTVFPSPLRGITVDASQIPDLVPILATVASVAKGETRIVGASRLRLKESDRLVAVSAMLNHLGASVAETEDGLIIQGKNTLAGGRISSFNDHRIAMSAAIASSVCVSPVIIEGAESAAKSYPGFWEDLNTLGAKAEILS